jgi:hypothetical protein
LKQCATQMPNPYRSWNIRDPLDAPGGVARDELGRVRHPTKTEYYIVRTSDKNAKTCVVTSFDAFVQAFPGASSEDQQQIRQAFVRFPNLSVTCYAAPLR